MAANATVEMDMLRVRNLLLVSVAVSAMAVNVRSQGRSVTVVTEPKAIVFIDGLRFGRTDDTGQLAIRSVAAGSHTLKVRCDGFKEKTQPLTAAAHGNIKVVLAITSDKAELAFQDAERLASTDRAKAIEAYQLAIKLRPNYPDAYIALARSQSDDGDFDEALKAIAAARKLRPGLAEASAVEGRIQKEAGYEAKSIAAFKRAITEGKGTQPEAYAGLGLLFKEKAESAAGQGDVKNEKANYAEAAKYLKSALKQLSGAPDAMVIYQLLGLIYERTDQFPQAIAVYNEFLTLFPDSAEASAVRSFIVQINKQTHD